jgi:hypothetical protein
VLETGGGHAEIIRFWRTVEMFSPQSVDKVSRERRVHAVKPGEPLPWEQAHELARVRLSEKQAWRHVVYIGTYPLRSVFETLMRVFAPNEESFDERPAGESALAAFVVSGEGRPLLGSEVLSSCAWATGRALRPGPGKPGWLTGFEDAKAAFSSSFEEVVEADPDDPRAVQLRSQGHDVGRPIGWEELTGCLRVAVDATKIESILPHTEIRINSQIVARRSAYSADGHDFLNSFIADDLAMVAEQVRLGKFGTALREYLRPDADLDIGRRVDVRERLDVVLDATAPRNVPLGRWPSNPEHPLALGQQLAVNSVVQMLDSGAGIFGVNGPPGTGKTTMLRDLVAAVVVERARRLAELRQPKDAFTGEPCRWQTGDYNRVVHPWKPQLTGFEMVVASANNGAVENVTNEIPARGAIDGLWRDEAVRLDYFPDIASALLAADDDAVGGSGNETGTAGAAWALMAARLGNKRNRSRFLNEFWYRRPSEPDPASDGAGNRPPGSRAPAEEPARLGLLAILKEYEQARPPCSWPQSVAEFQRALGDAASIQAARDDASAIPAWQARAEHNLRAAREASAAAQRQVAAVRMQITETENTAREWQAERERRVLLRTEHRHFRPGFLEWLTSLGKSLRNWRQRDEELAAEIAAADQAQLAVREELARLVRDADSAGREAAHRQDVVYRAEQDLNASQAAFDRARAALGPQFPDAGWRADRSRREAQALWTDPEWNRARTTLFLAALRLH